MSALIKYLKQVDLTDYTLLIPSVSVGNVPQLTVDILISTFNLQRTGIIWHPAIVPSVGGDAFQKDSSELTTACELYTNEDIKVAVIQLRSSIEPKYATTFFDLILTEIKTLKIKTLIILTSAFAQEMHDVKSSLFRYKDTNLENQTCVSLITLNENNVLLCNEDEMHNGSGFGLKLFKLAEEKCMNTFFLAKYTSEGDNRPDAVQMLQVLFNLFDSFKVKNLSSENFLQNVKFPCSWDHVFGNPPPLGIY